ncbi:MAG: PA2778 family cysteine peptidase [Rhodoferax sp.]|nr:PA2778 family cysteine peptidase [Rhodoferax sp.]
MSKRRSRLASPAVAGVFICAVLAGCAAPQTAHLAHQWPPMLPARAELVNTPFIPQDDYECGPAALAMVLQAAGLLVTADELVAQVYLPGRKGSLQVEMLAAARRNGLPAYSLEPALDAVLQEVAAGNPVLVFQNLSLPVYPVWHYAVVIGYDRERRELLLHSGRTPRQTLSLDTFERTWARGKHWSMVALPPTRLPTTAQDDTFARSVAALERVDPKAASTAYATALKRWPLHRALMLGSGNTAYALGDLSSAQSAYNAAVQAHPDFADAWNNLAQVLLDLGNQPGAKQAIAKAVALGGPRLSQYLALQETVGR